MPDTGWWNLSIANISSAWADALLDRGCFHYLEPGRNDRLPETCGRRQFVARALLRLLPQLADCLVQAAVVVSRSLVMRQRYPQPGVLGKVPGTASPATGPSLRIRRQREAVSHLPLDVNGPKGWVERLRSRASTVRVGSSCAHTLCVRSAFVLICRWSEMRGTSLVARGMTHPRVAW